MAGEPFRLKYPKIYGIKLTGKLPDWVSSKDVILEVLRRIDVKGGRGYILEYFGPAINTLSVPDRATISNMGTETGATTSIFPSDEVTKKFMKAMGREDQWTELKADSDAEYDRLMEINLSELEPLVAKPHSPGNVVPLKMLLGQKVDQVCIGSCTNSSYRDLMVVAQILKRRKVYPDISATVSPGSRTILKMMEKAGGLNYLVAAGMRLLENTCGPCIGMGQAPNTNAISVRTFNRNFLGRSGTESANVYLVSPEVAAWTAVKGEFTDPRDLGTMEPIIEPEKYDVDDNLIIHPLPEEKAKNVDIVKGPNIKSLPKFEPMLDMLEGQVLIKVGDNITTDHIMPAGAKILPLRSNIPAISEYVFSQVDPKFTKRAKEKNGGFIIGGDNYGQGSSREHAALAPKFLGVKAVIVKSFARIHLANLVNFGIIPLTFKNPADYDSMDLGDVLKIFVGNLKGDIKLLNETKGTEIKLEHALSVLDTEILKLGGKLPWVKTKVIGNTS